MQIFKMTFQIKEKDDEEWKDGFYFVDESIEEATKYISELYEEYEVRDLLVLTATIPGWKEVPVEKNA